MGVGNGVEVTGITPDDKDDIVIKFENGASDAPEINGIEIMPSGS